MSKTSKLLTQAGSIAALCFMFVAFQNCGKKMEFSSFSLEKATLVEIPDDDGSIGDIGDNSSTGDSGSVGDNSSTGDSGSVGDNSSTGDSGSVGDNSSTGDNASNGSNNGDSGANSDNVAEPDSSAETFICILEGPGKSRKLGIINDALVNENSAAHIVCTTERACLEVASQAFNVKEAIDGRGFCKGDSKRVHLSEDELQQVINNNN